MCDIKREVVGIKIQKLAQHEKVTKSLLAELSRDVLQYVYESSDIGMANRLIKVLSPVNKKVACLYFPTFLGWAFDEDTCEFSRKLGKKLHAKKSYACDEFLAVETNNIWVWAELELDLKPKPKNYSEKIAKLVDKALKDENEGIELKEVIFAILASDEVNVNDLLHSLDEAVKLELAS